uniref:RING-CH-type domain-containing protein n=1 Tax=Aegilops tauschii subsp. strangulata TaxID=200361 RepID=A0A453ABL1_AEGTS
IFFLLFGLQQSSSSGSSSAITNPMQGVGGGGGPAPDDQQPKRPPHLSIDIPAATSAPLTPTASAEPDATPATPGSNARRTPGSGSGSGKSGAPAKPPAPQRTPSFMLRQTVRSLLPGGGSFKSSVRGYEASLSRLFSGRIARTASLPAVDHAALSASVHATDKTPPSVPAAAADKTSMHRSQSLPMNMKKFSSAKSIKRMNSLGGVYRVVPSTPRGPAATAATSNAVPDIVPTEPGAGEGEDDHGEDIAEEEAVCRICMVELSEGGGAMKLECSCRGELALAHTDCALKWFGIKGTRTCEVCKEEVQNLPVTLLRVQSTRAGDASRATGPRYVRYRLWHGTPILVVISILAYFCFLEQLLVAHNGFAALAISLPFSCILGLFSSLTTTSMVARRYVWIYAAIQFLFVVFFTHLFYRYVTASAGCDIHHPGHLCGFRRGDDRKLHHHRGTEVEDYGPGSAAPCSQATTCCAAAAAGPGIRSAFRPALSRR